MVDLKVLERRSKLIRVVGPEVLLVGRQLALVPGHLVEDGQVSGAFLGVKVVENFLEQRLLALLHGLLLVEQVRGMEIKHLTLTEFEVCR